MKFNFTFFTTNFSRLVKYLLLPFIIFVQACGTGENNEENTKKKNNVEAYKNTTEIKAVFLHSDGSLSGNIFHDVPVNESGIKMIVSIKPNTAGSKGDELQLIVLEATDGKENEAKEIFNEKQIRDGENIIFKVDGDFGCKRILFKVLYKDSVFKETSVNCICGK